MPGKFLDRLTEPQMQAVLHKDGPLLVLAGPGSGKTRVITCRIAALVDADIEPQNICAITFTNKAAEEMRIRCSELLGSRNLSHISTFHSLCVRILRRFADLAEIKPGFSIFDTTNQLKCMKQAVSDCELDSSRFPPSRILEAVWP